MLVLETECEGSASGAGTPRQSSPEGCVTVWCGQWTGIEDCPTRCHRGWHTASGAVQS